LQLDVPALTRAAGSPETDKRPKRAVGAKERRLWIVRSLATAGTVAVLGFVVVAWLLPWYVRRQCIEEAASRGISLRIESVEIDTSGFRLLDVSASVADVPGLQAQTPEVRVRTSGLRPQALTMRRAEVALEGTWSSVSGAVAKWRSTLGGETGSFLPATVDVEDSRIVWQGVIGENARVEATAVHLEVAWRLRDPEIHARSDHAIVAVPGGALGPWRVDIDRIPQGGLSNDRTPVTASVRVRLALDPAVPDASTVLVVADEERTTSVDVAIPRSPLARLGVLPALAGLHGKNLQLEVSAHYGTAGPKRADARAKGGLYAIEVPGMPRPIDVAWDVSASGAPDTGLDVKVGRLAVGPLVGALTGMLKAFDDGFRVDLGWIAGPVPCNAFDAPLAAGAPFDIAYQLRKLAQDSGLTRIDGKVSARASLAFDSRDLGITHLDFSPDAKCQVAIFAP
jgi:hypothetical protein